MFDPPSGTDDLAGDVEEIEPTGRFRERTIDTDLGPVRYQARKPQPRSAHAIAVAANAKLGVESQVNHLTLFVRHHLTDESYEDLLVGMMEGRYPREIMAEVARDLSTWGTARPTVP
ncbi:hypothetical protein SEA_NHAGOS_32 [Gordonia phage NHagos]|nr:hypothetical protein SEA_NHAGOS_32 [Gordonia phage NHagos]